MVKRRWTVDGGHQRVRREVASVAGNPLEVPNGEFEAGDLWLCRVGDLDSYC